MYQHSILLVFVIFSLKSYLSFCAAYRFPTECSDQIEKMGDHSVQKKSLDLEVPEAEHVCPVTILKRHRPNFGHMVNGSFVEVQQDTEHNFEATFVECTGGHHRPPCHGIDTLIYSSECVTLYEWRIAFVRLPGLDVSFVPSKIKIPIACQCRLIRKLRPFSGRLINYLTH